MKRYRKTQLDLIDKSICQPLREMTENNQHTDAVVFLAEQLLSRKDFSDDPAYCVTLHNWACFIKAEHDRIGHLPYTLMLFRSSVLEDIENILSRDVFQSNKVAQMIHMAL